jgi:hypothetical protein
MRMTTTMLKAYAPVGGLEARMKKWMIKAF